MRKSDDGSEAFSSLAPPLGVGDLRGSGLLFLLLMLSPASMAPASTVLFTEEFSDSSSSWYDAAGSAPLGWQASGGPDGGSFAQTDFNFVASAAEDTPVLFRAQDEFGSSGGAFEGDWIADGVTEFSAFVHHDTGMPLTFFTRFSGPFNFPGATSIEFAPVPSGTWTLVSFLIQPGSPQFVTFEGSDFETVFGNIGHVQIGVSVPEALAGIDDPFTFSIDKPTIVPEPGTLALLGVAVCCSRISRRRRRSASRRILGARTTVAGTAPFPEHQAC